MTPLQGELEKLAQQKSEQEPDFTDDDFILDELEDMEEDF